ncbi:TIR domain-containing protein [Desulfonema limicola]|uniref:TIR domain-containing protein n=1 Tax=Desulfonema limicola TaxID=45656 RepID=A0A975BD36_9BACT|nr:toll/interleukin-1 receptor domain-containing protein [Desulfonema limicola]QTA83434.1 TIR domain-containing protein [Desulfonema limicola]
MVFISHAKEDARIARKLNDDLESRGISTWFDEKDLLPGQNWKIVIRQAIKKSDFLIILLSEHSVTKRGFVQAEQKLAFDVMDEMPESDVFVIPIRISECEIPYGLEDIHHVDLFPDYDAGLDKILRAVFLPIIHKNRETT